MKKIFLSILMFSFSVQIDAAEAELSDQITALKTELLTQSDRITRLEELLFEPAGNNSTLVVDRFAWQKIQNWNRVKRGMSQSQVESILGPPTKRGKIGASIYVTLYYQGEKSGAGYISGNITMNSNEDRVSSISKPVM